VKYILVLLTVAVTLLTGCQQNPYSQGEIIYQYYCGNCHMEDFSGLGKLIPPLDSSRLTISDPQKLVCLIRNGKPVNPETGQAMPANPSLNEVELANLINFLGAKCGLKFQTVQVDQVKKMLAGCHSR
jgi:mono/diheme cytochrome c family protein